jgi:hypothetical protein
VKVYILKIKLLENCCKYDGINFKYLKDDILIVEELKNPEKYYACFFIVDKYIAIDWIPKNICRVLKEV